MCAHGGKSVQLSQLYIASYMYRQTVASGSVRRTTQVREKKGRKNTGSDDRRACHGGEDADRRNGIGGRREKKQALSPDPCTLFCSMFHGHVTVEGTHAILDVRPWASDRVWIQRQDPATTRIAKAATRVRETKSMIGPPCHDGDTDRRNGRRRKFETKGAWFIPTYTCAVIFLVSWGTPHGWGRDTQCSRPQASDRVWTRRLIIEPHRPEY